MGVCHCFTVSYVVDSLVSAMATIQGQEKPLEQSSRSRDW